MEVLHGALDKINTFIFSQDFFWWHGVVLAFLWFFAALIAILLRKVAIILHATAFFIIDVITAFFLVGAMMRVYPHLENFGTWSLIKQGHIIGGTPYPIQEPSSLFSSFFSTSEVSQLYSRASNTTPLIANSQLLLLT
jgi:hypothetical protein